MMSSTSIDQAHDGLRMQSDESHDERDDKEDVASTANHKLSCQPCRTRKVKCDRNNPCTQCIRKKVDCTYPSGFKVRPKRQKVLVSNAYEDKIDDISRKLNKLCRIVETYGPSAVENLRWQTSSTSTSFQTPDTVASVSGAEDTIRPDLNDEPTLAAQAAFATDYAKTVFNHSIKSQEMIRSLERLSQMLKEDRSLSVSRELKPMLPDPGAYLGEMQLPPMQLAMSCIQQFCSSDSLMFYWTWDINTVGQLLEYTIAVYTSNPSIAELVIVNSTLSRLFNECIREESSPSGQAELGAQARQCEENLVLVVSKLPFDLPATFDSILALYHITIYMLGQCKPLAAWRYIAASTQMCQTLGYHRERALVPETAQQRRRRKRLVWMIVIMDKTLSLRIGRPSSIRDGDFTLEKVSDIAQDDVSAFSFMTLLSKWVDLSLLQGQAYDDIFSPRALLQPEGIRIARARALATDLQRVFETTSAAESHVLELRRRAIGNEMHELFQRADRINHLATLTLVYRAIPAGAYSNSVFCEECVATASEALKEHQRCLAILKNVEGNVLEMYLRWAILSSPFIPFIVLFCRALETSNPEYLDTLSSVVETLNLLPPDLPKAYRIQLKVFKAMYEVACDYIKANGKGQLVNHRLSDIIPDKSFGDISSMMGASPTFGAMQHVQADGCGTMVPLVTLGGAYPHSPHRLNMASETGDSGAELGLWLDQNQRMFTMLEDML